MFDITGLDRLPFLPEKQRYRFDRGSNLAVAEFDSESLSREVTENDIHIVTAVWHLTSKEYDYFQGFYQISIEDGALPFLLELVAENPDNTDYVVKFITESLIVTEPTLNSFIVSAKLEVYPNGDDAYQSTLVLIYDDEVGFNAMINQLNTFVNVDCEIL